MRILYLNSEEIDPNGHSGASTHIREIIAQLRHLGNEVQLVGTPRTTSEQSNLRKNRHFVKSLTKSFPWLSALNQDLQAVKRSLRLRQKAIGLAKTFKPHLIYERSGYLSFAGTELQQILDIPRVLEINGFYTEERKLFALRPSMAGFTKRVELLSANSADKIIVISEAFKNKLIRSKVDAGKISVIHNGVNPNSLRVDKLEVEKIRRNFKLEGCRIVGFVGHVLPWHGVDLLLEVASEIVRKFDDVKFLIVGPVAERLGLHNYVKSHNLTSKVIFTGAVAHASIANLIDSMDICLMPNSNDYGSPIKFFEYGAMGKPIIAPSTPAIGEIMVDRKNGILISPGNFDELLAAIERYLENPQLREKYGLAFREKVLAEHTWQQIGKMTEKLLEEVRGK